MYFNLKCGNILSFARTLSQHLWRYRLMISKKRHEYVHQILKDQKGKKWTHPTKQPTLWSLLRLVLSYLLNGEVRNSSANRWKQAISSWSEYTRNTGTVRYIQFVLKAEVLISWCSKAFKVRTYVVTFDLAPPYSSAHNIYDTTSKFWAWLFKARSI